MGSPPSRGAADHYAPGDFNINCSMCGLKMKFSEAVQNWQGLYRHVKCNEPRPQQDFVHSINSLEMAVPITQIMGEVDLLVCDLNGLSAIPDVAIPDCSLPNNPNWDSSIWQPFYPIPGGPAEVFLTTNGGSSIAADGSFGIDRLLVKD
jgi:hypothetical protein